MSDESNTETKNESLGDTLDRLAPDAAAEPTEDEAAPQPEATVPAAPEGSVAAPTIPDTERPVEVQPTEAGQRVTGQSWRITNPVGKVGHRPAEPEPDAEPVEEEPAAV